MAEAIQLHYLDKKTVAELTQSGAWMPIGLLTREQGLEIEKRIHGMMAVTSGMGNPWEAVTEEEYAEMQKALRGLMSVTAGGGLSEAVFEVRPE